MSTERFQLESAIVALEDQRSALGDLVVDAMRAGLQAKLASLSAPSAGPEPQLRQVGILFLDVVGSTTLGQHLDPESISTVMDDALRRATAIVESWRGRVLQYAGDNVLAAFGAEAAREDDSERAVRCGLALLQLGQSLGAEVEAAHGYAGLDVRVGIHTGKVLLGAGIDADGSIRGQAVNIAARMEQTAPAGALRISHDTHLLVRGLFEVQAQAPLAVKGLDEPMQSWLVMRALPRQPYSGSRGLEGVAPQMIGREAELKMLQQAFGRLLDEPRLQRITVVADAGLGKSRLLQAFDAWRTASPQRHHVLRGRAGPQTQAQPFGLLRDWMAWHLQIADDDTIETARAKMEAVLIPLFEAEDGHRLAESHTHLLGHLIGIEWRDSPHIRGILDDPRQIRNHALHAAARMLRRSAAVAPVLLLLEDLHWADDETLDFLDDLVEAEHDLPLLILAFSRPTLFERRADWPHGAAAHRRIDLAPLELDASRQLTDQLLQRLPDVPTALRERIVGSAAGIPFYMEELVRMLIDRGTIRTGAEWVLHRDHLLATTVPATLTGVIQSRLDNLPPAEKMTLQAASVIGPVFWDRALMALDAQARDTLPRLVSRSLVLPRTGPESETGADDLHAHAFQHAILHQVTYDTVLKHHKRRWHAQVAAWLARRGGLRANDFLAQIAEHHEQAGDDADAAEFHTRAAEYAHQRFGHAAVLWHVERALALLARQAVTATYDPLRWRLLRAREQVLDLQARREEQVHDLDAMTQLAETLDDDAKRAYAAWRRSYRALRVADWAAGAKAAREGMGFAARAGDDSLRLHAQRMLVLALVQQGDVEGGQVLARQALADARRLGLLGNEANLLNALSIAAQAQGDEMANLDLAQQVLPIVREIGDRRSEAVALSNLGVARLNLGALEPAQHDLNDALHMLRVSGDRVQEGNTLCALSNLALLQGCHAAALELAGSALQIAVAAQSRREEADAQLSLGAAALALGHPAESRAAYGQALALAQAIESPLQFPARAGVMRAALAQGDAAQAFRSAESLLTHFSGQPYDDVYTGIEIEFACHQVLSRLQDPRAGDCLCRAHAALRLQADAITDPVLHESFLNNIPVHREIVAAWDSAN
ncbi:MAG: AAA family ATPase [Pseudomonadota bacterium]|nr:AAA family ATPase [Pseudomonadota bacterium]